VGVVSGLVHVAGNAVLDVFLRGVEAVEVEARDAWGANVQLLQHPVATALGGCGAAPAYVLGRLGARVVLNTNIGSDAWGQMLMGWLEGVGVELLGTGVGATAVHVIALSPDGRRRSCYYTGADVVWGRSLEGDTPEWLLLSGYGKVQARDLGEIHRVCAAMRRRGTRVFFDPSPWFAGRVGRDAMHGLWPEVDCLAATEEELASWVGSGDCEALAEGALARGVGCVVVKRGAEGAFYAERGGARGWVATEQVKGANTVGAGDSFNGRLVYGVCAGEDFGRAVEAATLLATEVVRGGRGVLGLLDGGRC
jgi:ribokinase